LYTEKEACGIAGFFFCNLAPEEAYMKVNLPLCGV
jgi:hypothetical protein